MSEEELEDEEDDIENILEDEFPKDEELMSEEDEEQEIDALERLKSELGEKFEADMSNLQTVQVITFSFFLIQKNNVWEWDESIVVDAWIFLLTLQKKYIFLGLSYLLSAPLIIIKTC